MIYRHCESQEHFAVKVSLKQSLQALRLILGIKLQGSGSKNADRSQTLCKTFGNCLAGC